MSPGFADGQAVLVRNDWPERQGPVHIRTPHYLRGQAGHVERCLGAFANPEDGAFGRAAASVPLYHVRFPAAALWPEAEPHDDLLVEIFEHWLEARP